MSHFNKEKNCIGKSFYDYFKENVNNFDFVHSNYMCYFAKRNKNDYINIFSSNITLNINGNIITIPFCDDVNPLIINLIEQQKNEDIDKQIKRFV